MPASSVPLSELFDCFVVDERGDCVSSSNRGKETEALDYSYTLSPFFPNQATLRLYADPPHRSYQTKPTYRSYQTEPTYRGYQREKILIKASEPERC